MTDQKSKQKISTVAGRTGDAGKVVVERVFRAHTDPNIIPQCWSPRRFTTTIEKMDVRPAGIVSTFMQHSLIDKYWSIAAPVSIGKGKSFFKDIKNNELDLKLFKAKTYNHCRNYIFYCHSDKKEKNR
jgi:hypothetical protein